MFRNILSLFLSLLMLQSLAQHGAEPVLVTDMLKIKSLSGLSLSKDGSRAVFTVSSIEPDGNSKWEYRYENQLWTVNTDGKTAPKQLTAKENASQASISPDGKQLAFVRVADGKAQVHLLSFDGGEAIQLTQSKYGAGSPRWSPDGKSILYSASVSLKELMNDSLLNPEKALPPWPYEKPGFAGDKQWKNIAKANPDGSVDEVRAYLDNNATDKKARVVNKLNFQDESDVNPDMRFTVFFVLEAKSDAKPVAIINNFYRFNFADFTPDGKKIILSGNIDSLQHPDRALESGIFLVNTDGSNLKQLYGARDKVFASPVISPSGKWIAFQHSTTSFVNIPVLALAPFNENGGSYIEIPFDRNKGNLTWSQDEKYIYFNSQSNGGQPLYRVNMTNKKVEQLTDVNSGVPGFDIMNNKLVFIKTEVADPFELYLADATAKNAKQISSFNTEWIKDKKLSFPEKHSFVNSTGLEVEYWVMKPSNYKPGKKYPLLLEIHGGPSAMWGPGESSMWHEYQFFCSKGYGVVYCNPRGSGGYGQDFLRANINDWGAGPASDVLAALDKTIAEGWADTAKLMVTGGSYAGYLVAWIIGHDNRFKAACAQRGVYDLATFFGEGNAWRLVPNYFGGYPWEDATRKIITRESPINYVQNIQTPLIIFHGENDRRTGVIQSEMLYRSLKAQGKEVEYVRHPGATHEITRTGNNRQRIDQMLRTWEFFERWIR